MVRDVLHPYQISFRLLKSSSLTQMTKLGAGKSLPTNWGITFCPMSWLTKLLRGSSRSGQYHGKHPEERIWDEARNSVVIMVSAFYGHGLVGPAICDMF